MEASTSATLLWTGAVVALGLGYWFVCMMGAAEVKGKRAAELKMGSITRGDVHAGTPSTGPSSAAPRSSPPPPPPPQRPQHHQHLLRPHYRHHRVGLGPVIHFSPPSPPAPPRRHPPPRGARRRPPLPPAPAPGARRRLRRRRAHARHRRPLGGAHRRHHHQPVPGRPRPCSQRKAGLDGRCEVVCGNFLEMPFEDASFDAAYSIEATCHAPHLEDVYGEILPRAQAGGMYVTYEWVTTPLYRADDAGHVETVHGIERGSALPGIRAQEDIGRTARKVGLKWWRSGTWRCRRRGPGGSGSRWAGWPTGGTTSSSPSSPSSASPPGASSRSTICSTRPQSTSPAAARPVSSPHAHDPLPQAASAAARDGAGN
uniref:SAM-dependent methyltransferase Erg6/SMT-type domain-containing protein n=1 Tax=Ananas comosus var. bracteatus TaxID=296719 RepID=A0A6V7PMX4_ANACO|nr:unnamed protein product [Ananas comosus var. bracteatus]